MKVTTNDAGLQTVRFLRDADVVITSISAGRIPWPRCQLPGRGGGSGLLLDDELARAVRHESVAAIRHWWGVTAGVVWRWRLALGVGRADTEGSKRLIAAARKETGRKNTGRVQREEEAAKRRRKLTPREVELNRQRAIALDLAKHLEKARRVRAWKRWELRLLMGKWTDAVVAAKTGRTANAVRLKRRKRGLPYRA